MDRITADNLNNVVNRINRLMGASIEATTRVKPGPCELHRWNVGTYIIDWKSRSRAALEVIASENGSTNRVIDGCTKRELYDQMHAMIAGIEAMQKRAGELVKEYAAQRLSMLELSRKLEGYN